MTKLGRISNGALNALQRNPKDQTEVNTSSRRVARQVLIYLESADKNAKPHAKGVLQYHLFLFFYLPLSGIKDVKMQCF